MSAKKRHTMTTIEIITEVSAEQTVYRAICGVQQATGVILSQALNMLEKKLGTK